MQALRQLLGVRSRRRQTPVQARSLLRSSRFQYRSHSYEQAIASPYKYVVMAHGGLSFRTFRVPTGVTLVFLTYPGACSYGGIVANAVKSDANARATMVRRHKNVLHSVTYMPGDIVQDMELEFYSMVELLGYRSPRKWTTGHGIFRIGTAERFYNQESQIKIPQLRTTLSRIVGMMSRRPERPLVLFIGSCRVTNNNSNYKSCVGLNKLACRKQDPKRKTIPSHLKTPSLAMKAAKTFFYRKANYWWN